VRLSYSLTRQEYVAGVAAIIRSIGETQEHRSWSRGLNGAVTTHYILLAIVVTAMIAIFPEATRAVLVLAAAVLILDELMRWRLRRMEAPAHGVTFDPHRHRDIEAGFDADGVACAGREHRQEWRWSLVRRLHDLPDLFVMEFAGFEFLVIPKAAFGSQDARREWLEVVSSRAPGVPMR
jgi:hypothetical protein